MQHTSWPARLVAALLVTALALPIIAAPASAKAVSARLFGPGQRGPAPGRLQGGSISAPAQGSASAAMAHFFLVSDPTTSNIWWHSQTVVDSTGGVHVALYDDADIYYLHCAAGCANSDNWSEGPVSSISTASSLAEPTLAIAPSGHPRLMWYAENGQGNYYYYAECNANCTGGTAQWTQVAVASLGAYGYPQNPGYFALDGQGRPRMVYPMAGANYGFYFLKCDTGCTTASDWRATAVPTPGLEPDALQLAVGPSDHYRVLGYDPNVPSLVYAQCDTGCTSSGGWGSVGLFNPGYYSLDYSYALRLDSQGRPRIAYYAAGTGATALHYAWSDANSLASAGWSSYTLNYPANTDEQPLDLALDAQDRPQVAYATDKLDMSLLSCTAGCESAAPTWQQASIEKAADLNASYPIATTPGCATSTWFLEGYPSLALDADNNPYVSYYARHGQLCQSQQETEIIYDAKGIRFSLSASAGLSHHVYLPLIRR